MRYNRPRAAAFISLIITALGVILFVTGIAIDEMDSMWMIFIGIFVMLASFACACIFYTQARNIAKIISGEEIVARWEYDDAEKAERISGEKAMRLSANKKLLAIVSAFFVVCTLIIALVGFEDFEDALPFVLIMLAVLTLIWVVALSAPVLAASKMKKASGEALIGLRGAYVFGEQYVWDTPFSRFEVAVYEGAERVLTVAYSVFQRYGWRRSSCQIPVPRGMEEEAAKTAIALRKAHGL